MSWPIKSWGCSRQQGRSHMSINHHPVAPQYQPINNQSCPGPTQWLMCHGRPGTSTQLLAQLPPTRVGLTLSPAAEISQTGKFMEMKELLADNMTLISQLDTVSGLLASHMLGAARPCLRQVTSLPIWCYCFMGYMALRTATRDQLAYARLLIKEAQRHGGLGWLDYDRAFRQQAATDPYLAFKPPQFWVSSRLAHDFSAHYAGRWTTPGASVHLAASSHCWYPVQHQCKHPWWGMAGGDECAFHRTRGVNVDISTNALVAK